MAGIRTALSRTKLAIGAVLVVALLTPTTGAAVSAVPQSPAVTSGNAAMSGNAVVRWNETAATAAIAATLAPTLNPLHESRMYAIMHIAIHDALNAISPRSRPYAFQGRARHASPEAAIAAAARTSLVAALTDLTPPFTDTQAAIAGVETAYTAALAAIPDSTAKQEGIELGKKSAYTILAKRADDRASTILLIDSGFPQGVNPGEYRFTPGFPFAFAPTWGEVKPFALRSAGQFPVEPPFALGSKRYTADFNEVKRLGGDGITTPSARTADETQMARFWVESSPLLWNRLARQLATTRHLDLWQSARLFGLLDMALTDGYISTFDVKYKLLFWRPVTAIQLAATDGNPNTAADPTWTPLVPTPPIPDHDSGHSVEGGAAAAVLRGFFKTDRMSFSLCSFTALPGSTCTDANPAIRHYTSFSQASNENAHSRILVGFHFKHATTEGVKHGTKIGQLTVHSYLQPRH
ncbi:vanadium-dependent haloperoxidase [Kribbella sp. VKM Ac-2568]|uniref:vanadium-dependent haloperoxidase n=1 Tax=Kribbella sp. VKM Ac-2568 TaxID=2512219 RepID=UPI0010455BFA|nr:vanadium-dependent haloperoxidase [Kribbella sp. VKM Ac-2568]TCM40373.1 PAP2 superfamily protein [Kribbella sp. VKM Ac-2568]